MVSEVVEEYLRDVVRPTSKVPHQVEGYLRHIDADQLIQSTWLNYGL